MTLPASAFPVETPQAFLGVVRSATGKLWRDRLDARGAARALAIVQRYQLPEMLARVMAGRDVEIDAVEDFLDPTIRKLMPDPYTVTQMEAAAKRIADAAVRGEKVAIFGDYDVDGATSAALLAWHLRHCGLDPLIHIPDRMFEGYGPNTEAIRMLAGKGATLLVTVDCGTTSHRAAGGGAQARHVRRRDRSSPMRRRVARGRCAGESEPARRSLRPRLSRRRRPRAGDAGRRQSRIAPARVLDARRCRSRICSACCITWRSARSPTSRR